MLPTTIAGIIEPILSAFFDIVNTLRTYQVLNIYIYILKRQLWDQILRRNFIPGTCQAAYTWYFDLQSRELRVIRYSIDNIPVRSSWLRKWPFMRSQLQSNRGESKRKTTKRERRAKRRGSRRPSWALELSEYTAPKISTWKRYQIIDIYRYIVDTIDIFDIPPIMQTTPTYHRYETDIGSSIRIDISSILSTWSIYHW